MRHSYAARWIAGAVLFARCLAYYDTSRGNRRAPAMSGPFSN